MWSHKKRSIICSDKQTPAERLSYKSWPNCTTLLDVPSNIVWGNDPTLSKKSGKYLTNFIQHLILQELLNKRNQTRSRRTIRQCLIQKCWVVLSKSITCLNSRSWMRCWSFPRRIFGPHICGDALDILPSNGNILTGSWRKDNTVQIWDFKSGGLIKNIPDDFNKSMVYWNLYVRSMRAWKYHEMIDVRSSSSILRKMISKPQMGI